MEEEKRRECNSNAPEKYPTGIRKKDAEYEKHFVECESCQREVDAQDCGRSAAAMFIKSLQNREEVFPVLER